MTAGGCALVAALQPTLVPRGRETHRSPSRSPSPPHMSRRAHGDPQHLGLAPCIKPRTLTSRSRPCLLWPPLRTGRGGRDARGGAGAEHASVVLGTGGGALACSCVTDNRTAPAKRRHPIESRLGGVVMRSSARIPRVEINKTLV